MSLTPKERIIYTFKGKELDRVAYSPRLYYWYNANKLYLGDRSKKYHKSHIKEEYINKSQLEIYKKLKASPRYIFETFYINLFLIKIKLDSDVKIKTRKGETKEELITEYITPKGTLRKVVRDYYIIEYPIKTPKDIKIMEYVIENSEFLFLEDNFRKAEDMLGNQGIVSEYIPRSPFMKLLVDLLGFSRTIIFLKRYPQQIDNFLAFLDQWDDKMYELLEKIPMKIINFGENIDANLTPPPYFTRYLIPYYQKRVDQLHKAGKICHIHMDGSLKDLLPYFETLPFDGLEALTPIPQGDVKIEELKNSLGTKIYLDGIPSILFLPEYSFEYVKKYTKRILNTFFPNIILGVSDEFPPNGQIEKLKMITELLDTFKIK
ncbi:MAG: hypothetical protein BAJALOKI2v1_200016 [Promethearchaeota archaeon]|nr:MAG: hypothetical protein BAJALOKI2v1_200016 [Candidatus Lokiarchaeota archaeon]